MSAETVASISHLHEWQGNAATYWHFQEMYGVAREGAAILLNRVLHIDETGDTSIHLVVEQGKKSGGYMVPIIGGDPTHTPVYKVGYDPREIWIATTNGETISTYHTRSVHGIYWGGIYKSYDPAEEQLKVDIISHETGEEGLVDFNLASGKGSFSLGSRALGWILGASESDRLHRLAIHPDTTPPTQGAVAS